MDEKFNWTYWIIFGVVAGLVSGLVFYWLVSAVFSWWNVSWVHALLFGILVGGGAFLKRMIAEHYPKAMKKIVKKPKKV